LQYPAKFTQIWIFGLKIYHLATLHSATSEQENQTTTKRWRTKEREGINWDVGFFVQHRT
jgi:hypothetical protein